MPHAATLMSTCPVSGMGISRCTIVNGAPGARTSIARIFVVVLFVAAFLVAAFLVAAFPGAAFPGAACFVATAISERVVSAPAARNTCRPAEVSRRHQDPRRLLMFLDTRRPPTS